MTVADWLHLAFGAAAGLTLVAMLLFAQQNVGSRGLPRSLASLAGTILALLLLLAAAAQLEPVLHSLHLDAKTGELSFSTPKPEAVLPAFLAFVSWTAFLAALVGGVAAGLLAWVTRDDPSEEDGEAEPLADEAAEQAV
jgi:hypothetical protein